MQLAQFLGVAKIVLIVAIVANINPFDYINGDPTNGTPAWFQWLLANKLYACLMIFFISK